MTVFDWESAAPLPVGAALWLVPDLVERMEERVSGGSIEEIGGRRAALLAEHEGRAHFCAARTVGAGA